MPKLVVLVTPLLAEAHHIAEAWQQAGAPGVTFIESYGLRRLQETGQEIDVLPGIFSVLEMLRSGDKNGIMLLSVVNEPQTVDRLIKATHAITGDLNNPNNGILFVIHVEQVIGLRPDNPL